MNYQESAYQAAKELLLTAQAKPGQILVVGCSTSEVLGEKIGTHSAFAVAKELCDGILAAAAEAKVYLAAQCCEHLNRALILSAEAAAQYGLAEANVVPQPKAGGSFATALYEALPDPVAVEHLQAHCGIDIGDTLIGMHLRDVAVPVRLSVKKIGEANLVCARTRPKFIGGARAHYDESKL
jgi:uncharacterized protein (TIGR01440 family)